MKTKMKYGIDLGTTNSSICRMERGIPVIQKIEVSDETMPSCVFFNKKQNTIVGHAAYRNMKSERKRATITWSHAASNSFVEFKRTMGTDTIYHCSNMDRDYYSEDLSAEVLKALKGYVTDDAVREAVVTVPAKFTVNQKTATLKAAELAGIEHCELIQEPVAAAIAYGLDSDRGDGYWMVFDFGGGTFDAALIRIENGIIQVFDTAGDNYLGGKNIDYAIVDQLLMPYLNENYHIDEILATENKREVLREAMKTYAEELKNLSSSRQQVDLMSNVGELGVDDDGEEMELDLRFSQQQVFDVMRPLFQRAVDISKQLLNRNNLAGKNIERIVLVGGPTYSPLIREMLETQIGCLVDSSINPMTAVSVGASIYASTLDSQIIAESGDGGKVKLEIAYEATTVEDVEWVTVKLVQDGKRENVMVQLKSEDGSWISEKVEVDSVGNVIEVSLKRGVNSFNVNVYDTDGTFISSDYPVLSIMNGTKIGSAPLPFNIGISTWDSKLSKAVFLPIKGLEKNQLLPASGTAYAEKTMCELRPGNANDILTIPIYQADDYKVGTSSALYEYVADVVITGEDVDNYIKRNSDADVTLKVNSSEMIEMEIYFPTQNVTVSKRLDTSRKQSVSEAGKRILNDLRSAEDALRIIRNKGIDVRDIESTLRTIRLENEESTEKKMVLEHLKELYRRIELRYLEAERKELEDDVQSWMDQLKRHQLKYGNNDTAEYVLELEQDMKLAIYHNDMAALEAVQSRISSFDVQMARKDHVQYAYDKFLRELHTAEWMDKEEASRLVQELGKSIKTKAPLEEQEDIVSRIWMLYPDDVEAKVEGPQRDSSGDNLLFH